MQISGSHSLSSLRQPSSMMGGQQGQRLVFLYPMIFDSSLSNIMNDIRDFLSVDFMTEIKISNVLNITSKATQIGTVGTGNRALNPAQEVRKSLHYSFDLPGTDNNQYVDQISAAAYQDKLNSFLNFIRNQLQYDPRYQKLRPMISNITLQENLINIPLILGTKAYTSQISSLYWILLIAMAYGLSLDNEANLSTIERYLDNMPDNKYVDLLFSTSGRQMLMNATNLPTGQFDHLLKHDKRILRTISGKLQTEAFKSLRDLRACVNISKWEVETNHMAIDTNRISQTMVPTIPTSTQRIHFEKSMSSFNSYVSNTIVPILHNMEYLLGPTPTHINFQAKFNDFEYNSVESLTSTFIELSNHVTGQIKELVKEQNGEVPISNADQVRKASEHIKNIMSICQANVDNISEIKKILINELDPIVQLPIRFSTDDVSRFSKGLQTSGTKLSRHSKVIEDWIRGSLSDPGPFNTHINTIKDRFQKSIANFLYGPANQPDHALYDKRIENRNNINYFLERYQNFVHVICNNPTGEPSQITCRERLTQFIYQLELSIFQIMYFFYIWNFISYLCGYMKDVDIDIQIQRRDVLEFPNYCLVLPLDIIKLLYSLNTVSNFKNLVSSNASNYDSVLQQLQSEDDIIVNTDNINRMIQIVNRRLKVPNLIVINKSRNEVYYQFMYMNQPNKLSIPNMKTYVKHQIDILPGF